MKHDEKKRACPTEQKGIHTDPFGSYTGRPQDSTDEPVQDADDL